MLLKYAPKVSEIEEGVAFYGRSGNALRKSLDAARRSIRSPSTARSASSARSPTRRWPTRSASRGVAEEIAIVQPRMHRGDGRATRSAILNELELPLGQPIEWDPGRSSR